jgi:nicotinamidase/pyrazinamidase
MLDYLRDNAIDSLTVVGLATDYCVKETALDAIQFGFRVDIPPILTEAVGGPEAKAGVIEAIKAVQR